MSDISHNTPKRPWRPSVDLIACWAALMALLALTVTLAYQPLGYLNFPIAMTIALIKSGLVAAIFMELRRRSNFVRAFACAGFFWLGILLWLGLMDFLTRP
jgi:cytochrome c oxidase subunit 4